jgi:hypothetical protein
LDHAAEALLRAELGPDVPAEAEAQKDFFEPEMGSLKREDSAKFLADKARMLKKMLVHRSPIMPIGALQFCLDYARKDSEPLPGVFAVVRRRFAAVVSLKPMIDEVYDFRNTYVAHVKAELKDLEVTRAALATWISALCQLHGAVR